MSKSWWKLNSQNEIAMTGIWEPNKARFEICGVWDAELKHDPFGNMLGIKQPERNCHDWNLGTKQGMIPYNVECGTWN